MSLVSASVWVRRGVASQHPKKYQLDEKEIERVSALARIHVDDMRKEFEKAQQAIRQEPDEVDGDSDKSDDDDEEPEVPVGENRMDEDAEYTAEKKKVESNDLSEYKLDEYDEDLKPDAARAFSNIGGLTYYDYDEKDPYVTLKEDEDDDEDRQALEVLPTDNLVVTARTEDDISQLEIFVYDESQDHMHPHHDIMLPAKPLCLEWLDYPPAPHSSDAATIFGNYVAVGTFDPEIEIWSLDTVEQMYPDSVLGRPDKTAQHVPIPAGTGKKKKKKTKHRELDSSYHVDAVLSLSWNRSHRNLLASASADRTVKLWDLSRDPLSKDGGAIRSFNVHKDAVQAVKWNRTDSTVLLTGSYDRTVRMFDTRSPDAAVGAKIGAEVEGLCWDPFDPLSFLVSLENGIILNFDARALPSDFSLPSPSKWTLSAHDGAVSCMDINPHIRGCLITGGTDKQVKVWNIVEEGDDRQISMVTSRDLGIGKVFTVQWSPDDPLTAAAGGSKANIQIWDVSANSGARNAFSKKLKAAGKQVKEKERSGLVTLQDDEEEDDSGWEDEES